MFCTSMVLFALRIRHSFIVEEQKREREREEKNMAFAATVNGI